MALYPLPKSYHPDWAEANKPPKQMVTIDTADSLSRGLQLVLIPGLKDIQLPFSNWQLEKVGSLAVAPDHGKLAQDITGASNTSEDCGYWLTSDGTTSNPIFAQSFTFVFDLLIAGYQEADGRGTLIDSRNPISQAAAGDGFLLFTEDDGTSVDAWNVTFHGSGKDEFDDSDGEVLFNKYMRVCASANLDNNQFLLVRDGKVIYDETITQGASFNVNNFKTGFLRRLDGRGTASHDNMDGSIGGVFGFNRALSKAECLTITRDMYRRVLKPDAMPAYFTAAAAPAGDAINDTYYKFLLAGGQL